MIYTALWTDHLTFNEGGAGWCYDFNRNIEIKIRLFYLQCTILWMWWTYRIKRYFTSATSGTGPAYPSGARHLIRIF